MTAHRPPLSTVKKFYFLEYVHVLLQSVERYSERELVFNSFKTLKQQQRLGESKYKTLSSESDNLSTVQLNRYRFTFDHVIEETKGFELIAEGAKQELYLTEQGKKLLLQYETAGTVPFNISLFMCMEKRYDHPFRFLIDLLYKANKYNSGLLILPNYSPRELQFERVNFRKGTDIIDYTEALTTRLQHDIHEFLGDNRSLRDQNKKLIRKLTIDGLLPSSHRDEFPQAKYNAITKRVRDFWINYFLKEIYGYEFSLSSFDIWIYRGKQIGIIQATEFYPNVNGRIVYPTSIVAKSTDSVDFQRLYDYPDGYKLYVHNPQPRGDQSQNRFLDFLVKAYYDLRRSDRSYFVNLLALRELVCYNMKISEQLFEDFLNEIYKLHLGKKMRISISLEVDKLPEETKAIYLKQEPVKVDGKYRNIIAIDVAKRGGVS